MSSGLVAALVWGGATLGLLIAGWPRGAEREVLSKSPRQLRLLLFLPFSSWREVVHPADPRQLLRVRRFSLATALAMLCSPLLMLGDFDRGTNPGAPRTHERTAGTPSEPGRDTSPGTAPAGSKQGPAPGLYGESPGSASGKAEVVIETGAESALWGEPLVPLNAEELAKIRTNERLYDDAKINPHYEGNELVGVLIRNVGYGSFWHRVGVREDDLIVEVNGTPIDDGTATNTLMNALANDQFLRIRVVATDGESRVLDFAAPAR